MILFQYEHEGKTKTFENESQINLFTGASALYQGEFEYQAISVSLFYKIKAKYLLYPHKRQHFTYDDGSEMNAGEWVDCVTQLMTKNR